MDKSVSWGPFSWTKTKHQGTTKFAELSLVRLTIMKYQRVGISPGKVISSMSSMSVENIYYTWTYIRAYSYIAKHLLQIWRCTPCVSAYPLFWSASLTWFPSTLLTPGPGFQGLLHQWRPGMSVIFVSHQWLGTGHPDPEGRHAATLRATLQGILDGTLANKKGNISTKPSRLLDDLGSLSWPVMGIFITIVKLYSSCSSSPPWSAWPIPSGSSPPSSPSSHHHYHRHH